MMKSLVPFLPYSESDTNSKNNLQLAAGAIVGGSVRERTTEDRTENTQNTQEYKELNEYKIQSSIEIKTVPVTWYSRVRKVRSNLMSIIRPQLKDTLTLQEGLFKIGRRNE